MGRVLVGQTAQAQWGDKATDRLSATSGDFLMAKSGPEFFGAGGFSVRSWITFETGAVVAELSVQVADMASESDRFGTAAG